MEKTWMSASHLSVEYRNGVDFFLSFCSENVKNPNFTNCPCLKCGNLKKTNLKTIREHMSSANNPSQSRHHFDVSHEL